MDESLHAPGGNYLPFGDVGLVVLLDVGHPPAGATTLIVSLGIISKPSELAIIEVAVFLLVAQAFAINRLAGLPYPLWSAPDQIESNGRRD